MNSLTHLSLQKNELKLVPHLLLVDGRFCVAPDAALDRHSRAGRHGSRKSSRRSSRRSLQQHDVSIDVDASVTPDVTAGDSSVVTAADAADPTSTARSGRYCLGFVKLIGHRVFTGVFVLRWSGGTSGRAMDLQSTGCGFKYYRGVPQVRCRSKAPGQGMKLPGQLSLSSLWGQ